MDSVRWEPGPVPGINGHAIYVAVPQAPPQGTDGNSVGPRLAMMIAALRRRWLLASVLGIVLGGTAAVTTWSLIPETYTAFSELVIEPNRTFIHSPGAGGQPVVNVDRYKRKLAHWAMYPYVLEAAVRDPDVAGCPTLRTSEDPKEWLKKNIQISFPGEDFLRISATCENPQDTVLIVNAFTEAFMTEVVDRERLENEAKLEKQRRFLRQEEDKLAAKRSELEILNKQLAANTEQANEKFKRHSEEALLISKQIADVQMKILDAELKLLIMDQEKEANAEAPQDKPAEPEIEFEVSDELVEMAMMGDAEYQLLAEELRRHKVNANAAENAYKKGHPKIVEKQKLVDECQLRLDKFKSENMPEFRKKVIAQIRARQIERASELTGGVIETPEIVKEQIRHLETAKAFWQDKQQDIEKNEASFTTQWVEREVLAEEVSEMAESVDRYESVIRTREIETQNTPETVEIGQRAALPKTPDRAKRIKLTAMAGAGAFGLAALLVLWLEFRVGRVSSVTELKQDLKLPLMATIPIIPRRIGSGNTKSGDHRAAYWHSVLTESFDSARTLLLRSAELHSMRAFMITSATGGEGKTTLSCHLATSLSRSGRKTLLIDGDIRRPSIHRVFNIAKEPGLCGVLRGETKLEEAVEEVLPGLWVLPAGRVRQDVLAALAQGTMEPVVEQARESYDFVLLDSSPLLPVTDAALMAQYCDSILFSLRRDISRVPKVAAAIEKMNMLGVKILGAVAIGLDGTAGSNYSYPYSRNSYYGPVES